MNQVSLKSVTLSNGETLAYREAGEGTNILLLVHGNMTSSKHWDVLIDKLEKDYKIYAVDLRGFGESTYYNEITSLKDFSEDLLLFADALGLCKFSIAGWSTGGGISMQFAADYPDYVQNLILIESVGVKGYPMFKKDEMGQPIPGQFLTTKEEIAADPVQVFPVLQALKNRDRNFYRALWNLVIYTHKQPEHQKYEEYIDDMLTQRNLVDVDYALVHFNITDEYNGVTQGNGSVTKIQSPTLILQGDRDYVVPQKMGEEIANYIPHAKLVILENTGHSPLVDCLDELTDQMRNFIGK
ncbi:alpha/beta hydrolase [Bacillus sp. 165]|uniref:intracellular short-chain-length polyhydroxyalkanoate depolymerase n=1 Tax=Bacillus sp. 165 TaxID=1529117 RepID=UPI001ADB1274|nr:alpha/beta hydrolase [Bacillus sp. 165]MBO9129192.1 alpha/beta hydrolase [Bacillus sp. 165]